MSKIIIGIPAYNDEKNIGNLLEDILRQKSEIENDSNSNHVLNELSNDNLNNSQLEKILVVSDSLDNTDNIVSSYAEKFEIIKLIKRDQRYGKPSALNLIFNEARIGDILILLDADVRLEEDCLKYIINSITDLSNIGMVGGNPIPVGATNPFIIGEQISFFSWKLLDAIKNNCNENLYHAHGRILTLSKKLYNNINIPDGIIADDQYLYLYCVKNGMKFKYEEKAKVIFKLPKNINDHLKQSRRFSESVNQNSMIFGKDFLECNIKIGNKFIFIDTYLRSPYKGTLWLLSYFYGKIMSKRFKTSSISPSWEVSKTTK